MTSFWSCEDINNKNTTSSDQFKNTIGKTIGTAQNTHLHDCSLSLLATDLPQITDKLYHIMLYRVSPERDSNSHSIPHAHASRQ
jgi:hypothetical protein